MSNPAKALRVLKALEHYKSNFSRWDQIIWDKVKILDNKDGKMMGCFTVTEDLTNLARTLHGGFIASVADIFGAYGVLSHSQGAFCGTTDLTLSFLDAAAIGTEVLVSTEPLRLSKARLVQSCLLADRADGRPLAFALVGAAVPRQPRAFPEEFPCDLFDNSNSP